MITTTQPATAAFALVSTAASNAPKFFDLTRPVVIDPARAVMEADYAAADLDDSWIMSDAEADRLAYDSECDDRYEGGAWAW